ncbi:MAG: MFS transporter [Pirellulales bacterium]|nr:MFS transporter [Pirellulales bacterium]
MKELLSVPKEKFTDYSEGVRAEVPQGLSVTPLDKLLSSASAGLASTRREEFWELANQLRSDVAKSTSEADLSAAVSAASSQLQVAADKKEFENKVNRYAQYATAIFLFGWASGGLIFGVMGDRIGRAKTMLITILLYSAFTGLSSLSRDFWDFSLYRFLTGLGIGGEFAVGVALVAEVMPDRARPATLALLQMLSAIGNVTAALINMLFGVLESENMFAQEGLLASPWRAMFLVGAVPALLAMLIRWRLKEPERWKQLSTEASVSKQLGSYRALFGNPRWRKHALVGLALAFSGVVGLWAVGFFTPDLTKRVLRDQLTLAAIKSEFETVKNDPQQQSAVLALLQEYHASAVEQKNHTMAADLVSLQEKWQSAVAASPDADAVRIQSLRGKVQKSIDGEVNYWGGVSSICIQIGAFFGMFGFGYLAQVIGRRPTFAIAFIAAALSTAAVFLFLRDFSQLFWMVPLMGFFQLSVFAGYAMYFPELFPTHLRSTGTSFCYNVGRFIAAIGPLIQAQLLGWISDMGRSPLESMRYAGVIMCSVFSIGLFVLPIAPETKGKPLPE